MMGDSEPAAPVIVRLQSKKQTIQDLDDVLKKAKRHIDDLDKATKTSMKACDSLKAIIAASALERTQLAAVMDTCKRRRVEVQEELDVEEAEEMIARGNAIIQAIRKKRDK